MDFVKKLRSCAKDMRPSGLGGGGYALAASNHKILDGAADEIERLRAYILSLDGMVIGRYTDNGAGMTDEGMIVADDILSCHDEQKLDATK
jgi:hypothetical protein